MDLIKLTKTELLEKCEKLGIKNCKSKNKIQLIDLLTKEKHLKPRAMATKIHVCKCKQCKYIKNKRKNRHYKKAIKRLMNKRRRRGEERIFNYYWA